MPNYGQYSDLSYKTRFDTRQADKISRNFDKSDAYYKVTTTSPSLVVSANVPIHIYNPNVSGKRQKQYACHPDYPIDEGCVIDYVDGKKYLAVTQDKHQSIQVFGKLYHMNVVVKWKDANNVIQTHYGHMTEGLGIQDEDNQVPLTQGKRSIIMQKNTLTNYIYKNQRFLFGSDEVLKAVDIDDFSREGLLIFKVENTQPIPEDDWVNGVAYNGEVNVAPPTVNGIVFSQDSLSIPKGLTKTVDVYEYIASVAQPTTFTWSISGIAAANYTIVSSTGNSITIKCNNYQYDGFLVATKTIAPFTVTQIPLSLTSIM
jgi:hypothetical protein